MITTISIVVPVYSGQDYLVRLVDVLAELRDNWRDNNIPIGLVELILVDDSARDGSPAIVDELAKTHDWVTGLHLARNYGQHNATVAGILYSCGDWVATLDEDLQHPPGKILEMLRQCILEHADVAYAQPIAAVHRNPLRDWSSLGIKRLIQWVTGNPHIRHANSFRLIRGEIARSSASVAVHNSYYDVVLAWFTQRFTLVPMALTDERFIRTGRSGYRLSSLVAHAWKMMFSSQVRVLYAVTVAGFVTVALTVLVALSLIALKAVVPNAIDVRGWPSLMVTICFFGGAILFTLGIALQYLSTMVLRAHGKPAFFVIDRSRDEPLADYFKANKP